MKMKLSILQIAIFRYQNGAGRNPKSDPLVKITITF